MRKKQIKSKRNAKVRERTKAHGDKNRTPRKPEGRITRSVWTKRCGERGVVIDNPWKLVAPTDCGQPTRLGELCLDTAFEHSICRQRELETNSGEFYARLRGLGSLADMANGPRDTHPAQSAV